MSTVDTVGQVAGVLASGMFGGAFIGYLRDRRSVKAAGAIAEGTVSIKIDEDRLSLLRQSQDAERDVWTATRTHLQAELAQERLESAAKDRQIQELVRLVEELRTELNASQKKLDRVEEQLAQITGDESTTHPPPAT